MNEDTDSFGVDDVGNLREWTPVSQTTLFAVFRLTLYTMSMCDVCDEQMPSIALRLRRLAHYVAYLKDGTQWIVSTMAHIQRVLKGIKRRCGVAWHGRVACVFRTPPCGLAFSLEQ